jgi:hypothetical protein
MKIDLKNKYHITFILIVSVVCFMSAMVLLSPQTNNQSDHDVDKDTIVDSKDNCPEVPNSDQADADHDGIGDVCDSCTDTDGDGYGDPGYPQNTCPEDNCPDTPNADQTDSDNDMIGDACDECQSDPLNDADNDGICGGNDNCPNVYNPTQNDADGDGIGDVCEQPPEVDLTYVPLEPLAGETILFSDVTRAGGGALQHWHWTFGDNTSSDEQNPSHQYNHIGEYLVQLNVTDINGKSGIVTHSIIVTYNDPPDAPMIIGPSMGTTDIDYSYNVMAIDPNGNLIFYEIDWGDVTDKEFLGPFVSGYEVQVHHSWEHAGVYTMKVLTKDIHNAQSDKTTWSVHIQDLYMFDPFFMRFFKQGHGIFFFKILFR